MIEIHRWKTQNRQGQTDKYASSLSRKGNNYIIHLLKWTPFTGTVDLQGVIDHLSIENCNLPVCSAIASFLYGRSSVTVFDKFRALFFSGQFSICPDVEAILDYVGCIPFVIEGDGKGGFRPPIYRKVGYELNKEMYLGQFLPRCAAIARHLNENGVIFHNVDNLPSRFAPVDVEMAIFSWCTHNEGQFK